MTRINFIHAADSDIVDSYRLAASRHGRFSGEGDHTKANYEADTIAAAYRELRRRGLESQRVLVPLLKDVDLGVRSWAGAHALEFAAELGEAALEELAQGDSLAAFDAGTTLREWHRGSLVFL